MKKRSVRTVVVATSAVVALVFIGAGCQSYAWNCFKWNCLSRTPYLKPVDLAILPIGVYSYPYNHMCPEDAWSLSSEVGAALMMPIHWRTFIQSPPEMEPLMEPIRRLEAAAGSQTNRIVCREPGEAYVLPEAP